jgi:hypothetical protein
MKAPLTPRAKCIRVAVPLPPVFLEHVGRLECGESKFRGNEQHTLLKLGVPASMSQHIVYSEAGVTIFLA